MRAAAYLGSMFLEVNQHGTTTVGAFGSEGVGGRNRLQQLRRPLRPGGNAGGGRRGDRRGITLFDTADVYGNQQSETLLGQALGARRNQVVIATKFAMPMGPTVHDRGGSRRYIMSAVEASLRRLGTDYIDLYQMHAPDPDTPIDETLGALDDVVRAGQGALSSAVRTFPAGRSPTPTGPRASPIGARFVSAQNHYSLLERGIEAEVLGSCDRFGLGMLPFFPLASGMLTGKYHRNEPPPQGTRLAHGRTTRRARAERAQLHHRRGADRVCGRTRPQPARSRVRLAADEAGDLERHRRRDVGGASRSERRRVDMAARCRRHGCGGQDRETLTMCGRLNVSSGPLTLLFMDMVSQPYPGEDRHNMAPTEPVVGVAPTALGALEPATMRWWLTPYWSKEMSTRYSMFNAKAETIETSASFKEPFARRRCVVPVAGFYEWTKDGERKLPYYIRPARRRRHAAGGHLGPLAQRQRGAREFCGGHGRGA